MTTLPATPGEVTTSDDLARIAADLGRAANSTATRSAYAGDFKRFSAWCRQEGHTALPTTPAIVGLYVAALFARKPVVAIGAIERAIAGIACQHRLAGHHLDRQHPAIADVLRGAKRTRKKPPRQARPVISDELRRILEVCGDDHAGRRNRAMLLVAFFGALRGAELVGIELNHLTESPAGYRLLIPSSKGDQEGGGNSSACRDKMKLGCARCARLSRKPLPQAPQYLLLRGITFWTPIPVARLATTIWLPCKPAADAALLLLDVTGAAPADWPEL